MAEETTFLQLPIFSKFLLPFLLIFFLIFAILEKTKVLGEKKQIHALIAFVIGLIFVGAIYPRLVVENLILFLTVALVVVFVVLLIWGFIFGDTQTKLQKGLIIGLAIIATIVLVGAIIWATGLWDNLQTFLSGGLGGAILTNAIFLIVIGVALALVLIPKK
ncbi:hypothetical protein A3K82_02375 [Candidatus Pacearchaeota archaeon RBG_19FT_COMBO_34_9]|nr:MAG: hypothetical protein A3K82_02375 [Candidatus Pacearchaeota archaeon RBG_19FT_COMBO_34_9]OGJ16495.1 MAG: hypothetical protein A3K74_00075 [Candidatus Pacearchaeota archaeon RBG_13_33_26]